MSTPETRCGQATPEPRIQIKDYILEEVIGQGTYGKVRLGRCIYTNEKVAVKVIEKAQIQSGKQVARLQREIRFLKLLNHPHIVKVYEIFESAEFIYIIMEYAVGGELFDYIVSQKRVKEAEARSFFRMVLSAVDYCHQNSIIHRDLKPENLLLDYKKNIKIIDFGFGNNFNSESLLDTFCGSPFYAAPEMILGKKYEGPEVDMWSLGVILFALLCGHLPFDDDNMKELYKKIASGSYVCPSYLPPGAKHLISRLITVDPKKRATLPEVLRHPWVNETYDTIPFNFVPKRPLITDYSQLAPDITARLEIFGYTTEEIKEAFSKHQDFSKANAIRATYFLLTEMVQREQNRLRQIRAVQEKATPELRSSTASNNTLAPTIPTLLSKNDQCNDIYSSSLTVLESKDQKTAIQRVPTNRAISFNAGTTNLPTQESLISSIQNVTIKDCHEEKNPTTRRQSVPLMIPNTHTKVSPTEKFKEELRSVSGWFLNFSTTTNKTANQIIMQLQTIVGIENMKLFASDQKYSVVCEIDMNSSPWTQNVQPHKPSQLVTFQIEICKVPRMDLQGIHFKRLTGGIWNYKKACNRILNELHL